MKKLVCLILALILCLSATACVAEMDTSELQKAYDEEMHLAREQARHFQIINVVYGPGVAQDSRNIGSQP